MIPSWSYLDEHDRAVLRATIAFLNNRLADSKTIDWALRLKPADRIQRIAIEDLLSNFSGRKLIEPWAAAWRLIEESWSAGAFEEGSSTAIYEVQERLRAGDRSGAIISAIVNLVAPRLKVEPIDSWRWQFIKKPRHPRTFEDLLSASLTSGHLVDLQVLELGSLADVPFLKALATALEGALNHGLDIGRRLGWDGQRRLWQLGDLGRVYYVTPSSRDDEGQDPDAYHRGIAPTVKLLHAVVARIAEINPETALPFVQRWRLMGSAVHIRLWAAAARDPDLASGEEIGAFLSSVDERRFWDLHVFPEIAEVRATRFNAINDQTQKVIVTRLCKGPPREHWPKKADVRKVKTARVYWSVRELKRIEVAGGQLPSSAKAWLKARIGEFPELRDMDIEEGFSEGTTVRSVTRQPDDRYDTLDGVARLQALEAAFGSSRGSWDDDPSESADDWLRQPESSARVISDLEAAKDRVNEFPKVWSRFGWTHSPKQPDTASGAQRDLQGEADRVLALLSHVSDHTLSTAIEGVSNWLDSWSRQVVASPTGLQVWLRVWPVAVKATNAAPEEEDEIDLSVTARAVDNDQEPMDLDTLNTPVGKLMTVFLSACPSLKQEPDPFAGASAARRMRDTAIDASGRSGLIVQHRMIEALPYFLNADRAWTQKHLIVPLLNDDGSSLALWRAIARRTHFTEVLRIIGGAMAERATDRRLGRDTRQRLSFSLVVEALHAFREKRDPAVPNSRLQQMLRTLDDEVRAHAANAVQQFVHDLSLEQFDNPIPPSAAEIFRSAVGPFLRDVWPQERSLATPSVSRAFSDLPATSGDAFAEAVEAIERFLVPFDCWSMIDYGLYGDHDDVKKLSVIDDESKATAFLRLLDLTIGTSEGAVIPRDLTDALDQIRSVAPQLVDSVAFRRLTTAARR
jgi:hypothetical protein